MDEKKLIESLTLIKNICKENDRCRKCPFGQGDECLVTNKSPEYWKIEQTPILKVIVGD